ncbi:hypothetical protein [Anaerosinus massiliensis]|uniref:hypothetical protein n=1 Tax=Massilibacillus massiliensis TaxID=1806837 RepID=UPI000A64A41D|nr:hypothetical protein [Massilibacillus massiliensis]
MGIIIVFCFCLGYSVWLRSCNYRKEFEVEKKNSPLSLAIQELIAIAGGIYLSLIMLVSFLKISVPEKVNFFVVDMDPLAFVAISLAIVQPIIINLIKRVK